MKYSITLLLLPVFAISLSSCATKETVPKIRLSPDTSILEVGVCKSHGPINLLGAIGKPPDVPSGVTVSIKTIRPLQIPDGRYFIAPSGTLQVINIQNPKKYDTKNISFSNTVSQWKKLFITHPPIEQSRRILSGDYLDEIPWMNAESCFHAKLRYRAFSWGDAVLFLTSYIQDESSPRLNNAMLILVVQGITYDGRYAVNAHFRIKNAKLPESLWDKSLKGKVIIEMNDGTENAEKWLDSQPDYSFSPTIKEYETLLESLSIK